MTLERMPVGVVVERRRLANPWQAQDWRVLAVLPGRPQVEPWTVVAEGEGWVRYFTGVVELELFAGETAAYKDNLESRQPSVYIVLRRGGGEPGVRLVEATVDPGEVDAHADSGDDLIEAVAMPAAVAGWMRDFVARHHVERAFYKRQRDRADPEALARGRRHPVGEDDDG
ncbi:MAG TPA: DUF3305 domain-containing protein [Azospirillaceae bacterium]|nr:DUF3305 domain-containing protein [Azospirillaceae bacterium]